jgi:hypothetical protein
MNIADGCIAWKDAPKGVRALTTTRALPGRSLPPFQHCNLGSRCGDADAVVAANRADLSATLRLPSPPCWLDQVHGSTVFRATERSAQWRSVEADAIVASVPDIVCVVLTADCLPILVADDAGTEVAAIHAGWRGLADGVIEATFAAMAAPARRVRVWLGPAIGPDSYEVGDEVRTRFLIGDPAAAQAFRATRAGHWLCDLYTLARLRLRRLGVQAISGGADCTASDPERFFSYRRDGRTGRMASLIWRET